MQEKRDLLRRYNVSDEQFDLTGLKYADLERIYDNYYHHTFKLHDNAEFISSALMKIDGVHSVRYRVKNIEHLIAKIIRKKIERPNRIITIDNYLSEITDLLGIRIIHLFKEDWRKIDPTIRHTWNLKEKPIAYVRSGDPKRYLEMFKEADFDVKDHHAGYRSLHYILSTQATKQHYYAELQMRTIFEEGWSEIDHTIRYPSQTDNPIYSDFLLILNRLAGSADEMGSFIQTLESNIAMQKHDLMQQISTQQLQFDILIKKIQDMNIAKEDKEDLLSHIPSLQPFWDKFKENLLKLFKE